MKLAARLLLFMVLVFIVQYVFIASVPSLIFQVAKWRKPAPMNTVIHAGKTDARLRQVVLPNPDFIYSACFYDVSDSDLIITGILPDTPQYCSLSFYDDRAQPYQVYNNFSRQAGAYTLRLSAAKGDGNTISSPTTQGTVLMRILVTDTAQIKAAREIQQNYTISSVPHK